MRDLRRSMGLGALVAVVLPVVVLPLACTDAGGHESGGELSFEAGTPATPTGEGGPGGGSGTTWTDLYRDFFGPGGAAKCAGNGQCHGAADQPGAKTSGGYVCPDVMGTVPEGGANPAKAQCRDTMTKVIIVDPAVPGVSTCGQPFAKSYMHNVIRKATHDPNDENNMPKSPYTFTFSDDAVKRIDTWVQAGCPDN